MIKKAAVIGAGVMGAGIAAHLANSGLEKVYLFDIVPNKLNEKEENKKLTLESYQVRNRLALDGKVKLFKAKPSPLFTKDVAKRIIPVNLEDDMEKFSEFDLVIEAVVERMDIKRYLFNNIAKYAKETAYLATNTSGLSIDEICEELTQERKEKFLGAHFFNPPRQMKLLEIIPGKDTSSETMAQVYGFCEDTLGKTVVIAKNTPAFIANRIGGNNISFAFEALGQGYTQEEIDAVTGKVVGRPIGSLALADLIGADILSHDSQNTEEAFPWFFEMIGKGLVGNKARAGFYKREGKAKFAYDLKTKEYRAVSKVKVPVNGRSKEEVTAFFDSGSKEGSLAWDLLSKYLVYSADVVKEIANDIVSVDKAMTLGYNHSMGPFEYWDFIGMKYMTEKLEKENRQVPEIVKEMMAKDMNSFYKAEGRQKSYYSFQTGAYTVIEKNHNEIDLTSLKTVKKTHAGSLIDMEDEVLMLQLEGKHQSIVDGTAEIIMDAIQEMEANYQGLVIASAGKNFCTGANLDKFVTCYENNKDFSPVEDDIRKFQKAMNMVKYASKPVVVAAKGKALGGGAEICMYAHKVCCDSELNIGLVETSVGLIPSGGGTKEMLLRQIESIPKYFGGDRASYFKKAFDTIFKGAVSGSAEDAKEKGYLRDTDVTVMNEKLLLRTAKDEVMQMADGLYVSKLQPEIKTMGEHGHAVIKRALCDMYKGKFISEYDMHIGKKLGYVISSGELPKNAMVNEAYMMNEEIKVFLDLAKEEKTQERIQAMKATGKRLMN